MEKSLNNDVSIKIGRTFYCVGIIVFGVQLLISGWFWIKEDVKKISVFI